MISNDFATTLAYFVFYILHPESYKVPQKRLGEEREIPLTRAQ